MTPEPVENTSRPPLITTAEWRLTVRLECVCGARYLQSCAGKQPVLICPKCQRRYTPQLFSGPHVVIQSEPEPKEINEQSVAVSDDSANARTAIA